MARAGWATLAILMLFASGCGGDDEGDGKGTAGNSGASGSSGATGGSGGMGGSGGGECPASVTAPGNSTHQLQHDGVQREYLLHVPPGYDGSTAVPLILNFHGYTSNMSQQELFSAMDAKSDAAGFVVAYPNGLANPTTNFQSWNAGVCCAFDDPDRDDLGFVDAVLADIATKICVDSKRIFATGMSNGGYLSHLLGCQRADRFAAIAPVAGVLGIASAECQPARPMPVIHFHGTEDQLAPYDGGLWISVPQTLSDWATRNACTGTPTETFKNGAAHCQTTSGCGGGVEVTLCTIDGMGHCWPGQSFCPYGNSTTDISANDAMWEFFQRFPLP
jgi:polyhydroxybutyrate depolymerase